jgi:hypothetical protein
VDWLKRSFLARIRGVGDEFPTKNFFVGVEGVNDDIQQLLDLGLENDVSLARS